MGVEFRSPTAAERAATFPGRSAAALTWLYEQNPAGSVSLAAFGGDHLIAHAGLVSRRVMVQGRERRFAALTDIHGPDPAQLVLVARALFEEHVGPKANLVVTASPRGARGVALERLLVRMLGFETLHTSVELVRDLRRSASPPPDFDGAAPTPRIDVLFRFDEQARWLFDRCTGDWLAMTLRDELSLNWRFVDRPDRDFLRLGVRDDGGVLRAFAVLDLSRSDPAKADPSGADSLEVVDWLCPPGEEREGRALLRALESAARERGASTLRLSLPPRSPWFVRFQAWGWRVHPTGRLALAHSSNRRLDDLALRDGLYP